MSDDNILTPALSACLFLQRQLAWDNAQKLDRADQAAALTAALADHARARDRLGRVPGNLCGQSSAASPRAAIPVLPTASPRSAVPLRQARIKSTE